MQSPFLIHAGIAFLNLVGLGAGYLFLKDLKRWLPAFVIAAGLLAAALLTDGLVYLILLAVWLLLLAVDGYLQARKSVFEGGRLAQWPWLPIPIGLLLIALYVLGANLYLNGAQNAYDQGMAGYVAADCPVAVEHFERVTGLFRLADAGNNRRASDKTQECRFYIAGEEALQDGDYADAIASFDTYLAAYPNSPITQQTIDQGAEAYLLWATELRAEDEYQEALDKYIELGVKYPNATQILNVPAETAAANVEWGDYFHQNGEYEKAIEQYELVRRGPEDLAADYDLKTRLASVYYDWAVSHRDSSEFEAAIQSYQYAVDHFPESDSAEPAAEAIPPTYFEWAQSLFDEGDLQATLDMYDLIIETYPDSESAEQALAARATAYLGLAKQLLDEGSFNDSIDTYLTVQELTEDEEMLAQIEAGLADAIMGLAMDTSSEGQALINSTLIQVCDRTPATSPAVNILPEERGKFLACSNSPSGFFVSDDLSPQFPGEFRYALEVSVSTADLNSGRYGSRGDIILIRQRVDWTVHIIDVATGKIVTSKTFTGGTPPDFPRSHHFDSNPDYLQGPPPSMEDILNWLYSIF